MAKPDTETLCIHCVAGGTSMGLPSSPASWEGPDGEPYCTIHYVWKFGHNEALVPLPEAAPKTKAA